MKENNFKNGCFLISRSIFESEIWYKQSEYLKIFLYISGKVNHKDNSFYEKGSNFFNFSTEIIPGVTQNQIREFFRWARSEKVKILTTQKTTRGMIVKLNNYKDYQNIENYKIQHKIQNRPKTDPKQTQHYKQ